MESYKAKDTSTTGKVLTVTQLRLTSIEQLATNPDLCLGDTTGGEEAAVIETGTMMILGMVVPAAEENLPAVIRLDTVVVAAMTQAMARGTVAVGVGAVATAQDTMATVEEEGGRHLEILLQKNTSRGCKWPTGAWRNLQETPYECYMRQYGWVLTHPRN